jgi:hypothetical protein
LGYFEHLVPDGFNHLQTHVDAVVGVVGSGNGQTAHAVIAVAQNFYPHALVLLNMKEILIY